MEGNYTKRLWFEEDLGDGWKWALQLKRVLYSARSEYQEIDLIHTGPFGKALLLDGKMQSSEVDEWVYHELLVHPAMLLHPNPKTVFICGGGEGATAREVLRHKSVEKVVMVDIDQAVCDFCREHLPENREAFASPRLQLVHDDAAAALRSSDIKFDVIIGDLADPLDGGPCYQLYTREFYESTVLAKLNPGGIFVTQSGPAGFTSCTEVFTSINRTLRAVFPTVLPYTQHMPSYCDVWGWNIAFTDASQARITGVDLDARILQRLDKELRFLDGETFGGLCTLNKHLRAALKAETHVFTGDAPRFIHGQGRGTDGAVAAVGGENGELCGNGGVHTVCDAAAKGVNGVASAVANSC